ncbi:MAG: M42 family metallopeptidase [Chloroflexi bacterium]|nr:M42 family metallopeptidase [Chloroflexota bacterium]
MKSLIQKLVEIPGPSGYESQVREAVKDEVEPYVDEMQVDPLGNLITRKGSGGDKGLKVMLSAHLDEIGVMVSHVDKNGFARFTQLGTVFPRNTAGGRVRFLNGAHGVIGMEVPPSRSAVTTLNKMYIDLGVTSKKDCPVKVGDVAAFERTFQDLGKRMVSKAMDDRIGVAVLIETLKALKSTPHQVFGVFSVQEEVGVRGATTAAFGVNPDLGLAIDTTGVGDTPKSPRSDLALGKGPAIKIKDFGMISDPRVVAWIEAGAKRAKIPYQLDILIGGSTDARAIQLSRAGVPSSGISIPSRYIHSPSEMVDFDDVKNTIKLLVHLLSRPIKLQ